MPDRNETISFDYHAWNTVKYSWSSPFTWRNCYVRAPIRRFLNDFGPILARCSKVFCVATHLWPREVFWCYDVIVGVENGWGECIIPIASEICAYIFRFDSRHILSFCLNHFILHVMKRIKYCFPCLRGIRLRQHSMLLIPTMHGQLKLRQLRAKSRSQTSTLLQTHFLSCVHVWWDFDFRPQLTLNFS